MTRGCGRYPFGVLTLVVGALLLLDGLVLSTQAKAAFPGLNGLIAFSSNQKDSNGSNDIYVMEGTGQSARRLTHHVVTDGEPGEDLEPSFSANGKRIVFTRLTYKETSPGTFFSHTSIYVLRANGTHLRQLTHPGQDYDQDPSFSPSGKRIVFSRQCGTEGGCDSEIFAISADGTHTKRLTHSYTDYDRYPIFSPNGKNIFFARNGQIWVMRPNGSHQRRLTSHGAGSQLNFSPDGKRLVSTETDSYSYSAIVVVNANGTHQKELVRGTATEPFEQASFSPNGKSIVFEKRMYVYPFGFETQADQVYVMEANGRDVKRITHNTWCWTARRTAPRAPPMCPQADKVQADNENPNWGPEPR